MIENDAPIPKHVPQHRPPPLPKEFQETLEALMSQPGKTEQLEALVSKSIKESSAANSTEEPSKPWTSEKS